MLPAATTAHLDSGLRIGEPIALRDHTLVIEGTAWLRVQDRSTEDLVFTPTLPAPTGEIAARLQW